MGHDEYRNCPYCDEEIKRIAKKCRYCKSMLNKKSIDVRENLKVEVIVNSANKNQKEKLIQGEEKDRVSKINIKQEKSEAGLKNLNSGINKSIRNKKIIHVVWYIVAVVFLFSLIYSINIIGLNYDEKSANSTPDFANATPDDATITDDDSIGEVIPDYLVLCKEDITVKYEDRTISLSRDGGRTYHKSIFVDDIDLQHLHVFDNGTLFFVDHTKCYYSHDWENLHESTVLDINGDPFIPYNYNNFSIMAGSDTHRHMIDGQEILCWGNYDSKYDTQYNNVNVWYTVDKGETVKSAYRFRATREDDGSGYLHTRHIHAVNFNPTDNSFWLQTGDGIIDGVDDRHVLKGTYDLEEDQWNWQLVGTGKQFKWGAAVFIGNYIYYAWDVSNGGVVRVPYDEAGNTEEHDLVCPTENDCLTVIKSHTGEIIAVQTIWGGNADPTTIYYTPDRETWYKIETNAHPEVTEPEEAILLSDMSTDNWGRVRAGGVSFPSGVNLPAVFLDEFVRAEFPDAFKPPRIGSSGKMNVDQN